MEFIDKAATNIVESVAMVKAGGAEDVDQAFSSGVVGGRPNFCNITKVVVVGFDKLADNSCFTSTIAKKKIRFVQIFCAAF